MELAKEELSDIHTEFMSELNKYRNPQPKHPETEEEKARIIKIIKDARTDNGEGVVSTRRLSIEIEKEFGYKISHTTISEWEKF